MLSLSSFTTFSIIIIINLSQYSDFLGLLRRRENLAILDSVSLSSAAAAVSGVGAVGGGDGASKTGQSMNWPVLKKLLRFDFDFVRI